MNFPIIPDYSLGRFWQNHDFLLERWASLMLTLKAKNTSNVFQDLFSRYSEDHRHYHTPVHIENMLREFKPVRHLSENPNGLEAAIFFHDFIYGPLCDVSCKGVKLLMVENNLDGDSLLLDCYIHNNLPFSQEAYLFLLSYCLSHFLLYIF